MPTYEYLCEKCGHRFDVFQSISAEPLKICPKEQCPRKQWGRGAVKKQINAGAGLLFKGSGFYITDYRSEGYKAAAKKDASSGSSSSSSSGAGSSGGDAKPAAKSESKASTPAKGSAGGKTKS